MKRFISFFSLIVFLASSVSAYNFMVNGLCFNINSDGTTVTVTYQKNSAPRYSSLSGALIIPSTVTYNGKTYSVTSIGYSAFSGCSDLTSVTIPNSVTAIYSSAFSGCSGLTKVEISDMAAWCRISFGDSGSNPLYYAHHLFFNDSEIKDLVIPDSVTSIGDYAFYYCSGLTSVTIPNSVTSIGHRAFVGCSGLTGTLTIGNSITSIGNYAFYYCSGLTSVTIPNSVTSISHYAFSGCSGLTSVTIPNSVMSIGDHVFYGCI